MEVDFCFPMEQSFRASHDRFDITNFGIVVFRLVSNLRIRNHSLSTRGASGCQGLGSASMAGVGWTSWMTVFYAGSSGGESTALGGFNRS